MSFLFLLEAEKVRADGKRVPSNKAAPQIFVFYSLKCHDFGSPFVSYYLNSKQEPVAVFVVFFFPFTGFNRATASRL